MALRFLLVLATLAAGTGCSVLFVDSPPAGHRQLPYFDCTSSRLAPGVDLGLGLVYGIAAAAEASDSGSASEALVPAVLAAALSASAAIGYHKTAECREAQAEMLARLRRNAATPTYAAPQAPFDPWLASPSGSFAAPPPTLPPPPAPRAVPPPAGGADGGAPPASAPRDGLLPAQQTDTESPASSAPGRR